MPRYHVNPATEKVSACRATIKCKFGNDTEHGASQQEAMDKYFDKKFHNENNVSLQSFNKNSLTANDTAVNDTADSNSKNDSQNINEANSKTKTNNEVQNDFDFSVDAMVEIVEQPRDMEKLLLKKYPDLTDLSLSNVRTCEDREYFVFNTIAVEKKLRGSGIGSKVLADVVAIADKKGWEIALTPSTDLGGSSVARLKKFYKKFGFVENKGKNKNWQANESMIRLPEK